jgi:sigma-B regulation protein RsbQ
VPIQQEVNKIMTSVQIRNNVKVLGKGDRPLVFAHGFGCDQEMWRYVSPHFEEDYRVVLFDYVGSGASDWGAYDIVKYDSLNGYAQDVLDIVEDLGLQDAIFVGHSVSGMIGALASIVKPSYFGRLIMLGPSPCYKSSPSFSRMPTGPVRRSRLNVIAVLSSKWTGASVR